MWTLIPFLFSSGCVPFVVRVYRTSCMSSCTALSLLQQSCPCLLLMGLLVSLTPPFGRLCIGPPWCFLGVSRLCPPLLLFWVGFMADVGHPVVWCPPLGYASLFGGLCPCNLPYLTLPSHPATIHGDN